MAYSTGCRLQLVDGRSVPVMDSDFDHLCDLFVVGFLMQSNEELVEYSTLQASWVEIHAKYIAINLTN